MRLTLFLMRLILRHFLIIFLVNYLNYLMRLRLRHFLVTYPDYYMIRVKIACHQVTRHLGTHRHYTVLGRYRLPLLKNSIYTWVPWSNRSLQKGNVHPLISYQTVYRSPKELSFSLYSSVAKKKNIFFGKVNLPKWIGRIAFPKKRFLSHPTVQMGGGTTQYGWSLPIGTKNWNYF